MKLYTIKMTAMGFLILGCLSSCGDSWMDVESKTESNSGNFYKSQEDGLRSLYATRGNQIIPSIHIMFQ